VTDLTAFSARLADHLRSTQTFQTDPAALREITLAGRPAVVMDGTAGGSVFGLSRRDVWVQLDDHRFLVLRATGPTDRADEVAAAAETAAGTLRLFDPAATRAKLERDLARGSALLEELDADTLRAALTPGDDWFALVRSGKVAGFVHIRRQWDRQDRTEGLRVVTETAVMGPAPDGTGGDDERRTFARENAFCSFDRTFEQWESFSVVFDGADEQSRHRAFGIRQHDLLLTQTVIGPGQTRDRPVKVPMGIYLPRAMASVAPVLLDRSQTGGYAFGQYDDAGGEIEMRTLTVTGAATITLGGETFHAVALTDQAGPGAPPTRIAIDDAGRILTLKRPDGTVLQRTTEQAIRSRFAEALNLLARVGRMQQH